MITTTEEIEALDPFIASRFLDTNLSVLATTAISSETSGTVEPLGKIPSGLKEIKFDTFDVRGRPGSTEATQASLRNAFKTAVSYSNNPDGWLTFYSPNSGCGKTHLAHVFQKFSDAQFINKVSARELNIIAGDGALIIDNAENMNNSGGLETASTDGLSSKYHKNVAFAIDHSAKDQKTMIWSLVRNFLKILHFLVLTILLNNNLTRYL